MNLYVTFTIFSEFFFYLKGSNSHVIQPYTACYASPQVTWKKIVPKHFYNVESRHLLDTYSDFLMP